MVCQPLLFAGLVVHTGRVRECVMTAFDSATGFSRWLEASPIALAGFSRLWATSHLIRSLNLRAIRRLKPAGVLVEPMVHRLKPWQEIRWSGA